MDDERNESSIILAPNMDFETRKQEFLTQYKHLIDEFHCDFMSHPIFTPNANGTWDLRIITEVADTTDAPVPSPFQV